MLKVKQLILIREMANTNRSIRMNLTLMNSSLLSNWAMKMKSKLPPESVSPKGKEDEGSAKTEMTEEDKKKQEEQKQEEKKKEDEQKKQEEMKKKKNRN